MQSHCHTRHRASDRACGEQTSPCPERWLLFSPCGLGTGFWKPSAGPASLVSGGARMWVPESDSKWLTHTSSYGAAHPPPKPTRAMRETSAGTYVRRERGGVPGPGLAPLQRGMAAGDHLQGARRASTSQTQRPRADLTARASQRLEDKEISGPMGKLGPRRRR